MRPATALVPALHLYLALGAAAKASKPSTTGGSKACSHTGFFSKRVVPLCEKHFPEESSKHIWIVQFYHPYVKRVVDQREAFEQLAAEPEKVGAAKVGAVDCQQNADFCVKNGIERAPTTRIHYHGYVREFESEEHTVEAFRSFATESLEGFKRMEEALDCSVKGVFTDASKDAAVPLCLAKFPPSTEPVPWLISFYEAGNINKDKTQRGVMNKLAERFGNAPPKKVGAKKKALKLRVGAVECGTQGGCEALGISSFPAVRFYASGAEPVDFDSFFDREELQKWADGQLRARPQPKKVEALVADMPEGGGAGGEL